MVNAHGNAKATHPHIAKCWNEGIRKMVTGRAVRIKPVPTVDPRLVRHSLEIGCDATRFYLVHDEDSGCVHAHVCEHEILTD